MLFTMAINGLAQNPDIKRTTHWYFGYGAGLDFSSGTPVVDTTGKSNGPEQSFTMSDTCGNLLFYGAPDSNDAKLIIRDKNHQIMPNGVLQSCCNPTQCACIPQPQNDSIYYIFYTEQGGNVNGQFLYAIVDINANGGLGAIISKDNVLIDSMATEKVGVTKHCNGTDFWIASKKSGSGSWVPVANQLYVWSLTSTGLSSTPVMSAPGNIGWELGDGYFRFSPDGSMAATTYSYQSSFYLQDSSYVEIYQFDNCTGIFSNPITIQYPYPYGISFSPDNSKLYIGCLDGAFFGSVDTAYFRQYDVTNYNQNSVLASEFTIDKGTIWNNFQMGMDGKIYVQDIDTSLVDYGLYSIGVINNPNASGTLCNYIPEQVDMLSHRVDLGFPYWPDSYFNDFNYTNCITGISENETDKTVAVYPNPFDDYINIHYTEPYYLRLIDITGKLIYQQNVTSEYYQLNTSALEKGIYLLNILPHNKSININQKIIKP